MVAALGLAALGLAAGMLSGLMGIGGGIIVIPSLVYFWGMAQKTAQGTTLLMMLPPIGLLAALEYLRRGEADWRAAIWISAGFLVGGYLGAWLVSSWNEFLLKRLFGIFMIAVGLKMFLKP